MRRSFKIAIRYGIRGVIAVAIVAPLVALFGPPVYVETFCHEEVRASQFKPLITDPKFQRPEANSYLTYPEWHIVYAYDGLAETLKNGDEHDFEYWRSVKDFWKSDCALSKVADLHGGADSATRMMNATIGVSFTLEMGLKAAYEDTLGHMAAWWRGPSKTPQDLVASGMAADYAAFLRQVPWYKYPFQKAVDVLYAAPHDGSFRGFERRVALGIEWKSKIVYAGLIAKAVDATGQADLVIRSVVTGLPIQTLQSIQGVVVVAPAGDGFVIETPRYDAFTHILSQIAMAGGNIEEIAGNDDVMVGMTLGPATGLPETAVPVAQIRRVGFPYDRSLVSLKVADLADLMRQVPIGDPGIEHVFDY